MYPILQKIGYTKAGKCGLWGHCDLIWFFFQHLKTTRIKLSNDWAVIRRQPFIETLLGDTQSAYIHFFSLCSSSPPLPAPPCSLPQSSSWRRWFGFVRLDGGFFFFFSSQTPVLASSLAWRVSEMCAQRRSVCTLPLSLSLSPPWKTSLFSFFANVCGTGINMLCAKWITAN